MLVKEFYEFMEERENIRLKKEAGQMWPWTKDIILQVYKFTNVKREHDRTTRWMRKHWTDPHKNEAPWKQLLNCAIFRYFGTIEFAKAIGWQNEWGAFSRINILNVATKRLKNKDRVFTGAYVITNQGISAPKQDVVVNNFLTPFAVSCPALVKIAQETSSWRAVAEEMMKLKGFGGTGFMTKEILQDALHTPIFNNCTDRNTWCPIGPGARRGLNRVMGYDKKAKRSDKQMLRELITIYSHRGYHWPKDFVQLELHDIQFQLCEFDKYERTRLNEGRPRSKYHQINKNKGTES